MILVLTPNKISELKRLKIKATAVLMRNSAMEWKNFSHQNESRFVRWVEAFIYLNSATRKRGLDVDDWSTINMERIIIIGDRKREKEVRQRRELKTLEIRAGPLDSNAWEQNSSELKFSSYFWYRWISFVPCDIYYVKIGLNVDGRRKRRLAKYKAEDHRVTSTAVNPRRKTEGKLYR